MIWETSEMISLASGLCTQCHGLGMLLGRRGATSPCSCVLRSVFRACLRNYKECLTHEGSDRSDEYKLDVLTTAAKLLADDQYYLFCVHYLEGSDPETCRKALRVDNAVLHHLLYQIETVLGRAYREREDPLFPIYDYFNPVQKAA